MAAHDVLTRSKSMFFSSFWKNSLCVFELVPELLLLKCSLLNWFCHCELYKGYLSWSWGSLKFRKIIQGKKTKKQPKNGHFSNLKVGVWFLRFPRDFFFFFFSKKAEKSINSQIFLNFKVQIPFNSLHCHTWYVFY